MRFSKFFISLETFNWIISIKKIQFLVFQIFFLRSTKKESTKCVVPIVSYDREYIYKFRNYSLSVIPEFSFDANFPITNKTKKELRES